MAVLDCLFENAQGAILPAMQRGLKACAVDSEVIACCDIQTNYPAMLICGLLEISMPALASAL